LKKPYYCKSVKPKQIIVFMKYIINIILLAIVCYLGYELFNTVKEVVVFNKEKAIRDEATIDRLKLIRRVQLAHKTEKNQYAGTFDSLKLFALNGNYTILTKIGDPNDSTIVARTDTSFTSILDSLFKGDKTIANELDIIPHSGGAKFSLQAGKITKNDIEIPAFEVKAPYKAIYNGLVEKYYAAKLDQSMQVGSMADATTSGNWGE